MMADPPIARELEQIQSDRTILRLALCQVMIECDQAREGLIHGQPIQRVIDQLGRTITNARGIVDGTAPPLTAAGMIDTIREVANG